MPFQILSLTGGGYLGFYTVAVLAELEKWAGRPIAQSFDLMAGTSIGGIIALCLAHEVPAARIRHAFEESGPEIFSGRPKSKGVVEIVGEIARSAFAPRHDDKALRSVVEDLLGRSVRLGDLAHPVIISSVDLTTGAARLFVSRRPSDRNLSLVDVAMATSAVPSFFPMVRIRRGLFADGGLFANAPDLQAVHEAEINMHVPFGRIRLLSIGTTSAHFRLTDKRSKLGMVDWLTDEHLMRISMAAQQTSVDEMLRERLKSRYLRIDCRQSPAQQQVLGLNVATVEASRLLEKMAKSSLAEIAGNPLLERMLRHKASRRPRRSGR